MKSSVVSVLVSGCLLSLGNSLTFGFQEAALTGAAAERERDTYRIYSLLLTNPITSHGPDTNARYLIRATALVESWRPMPCVSPPKSREAEFREVLADFENRKDAHRVLKWQLSIAKPYELLNEAGVEAFQEERENPKILLDKNGQRRDRFKGVSDVFTFADVYFSKNGRMALTAMSTWCGSLCALHRWRIFEKVALTGEWQERLWVTCSTMADYSAHQNGHHRRRNIYISSNLKRLPSRE